VVPTFYDSIEIARDRAIAKFRRRAGGWNPLVAFAATIVEAVLTILLVRFAYRAVKRVVFRRGAAAVPDAEGMPVQPGD
jgi:hydrophobic/amphiphilic exporter-1 (mainly G- bacteria), HAE1 family